MGTLHVGLRVRDLDRSLAFYAAVGDAVVGDVPETPLGHLTMLQLPRDEFVSLELVDDPGRAPTDVDTNLNHLVVQVESLDATAVELARRGIAVDTSGSSGDPAGPRTAWIVDPDGNRIELVQWPAGHPDGLSDADWAGWPPHRPPSRCGAGLAGRGPVRPKGSASRSPARSSEREAHGSGDATMPPAGAGGI